MHLKSIKLKNIRSYENQSIDFPSGSTLLAGDIGSGKSTILLAIEFALFGTKRAELSGSALLRHGKKEGEVELNFELDGKDVIIKRKLKRGKEDIQQESGYIITNGIKKEGTHIEIKSAVLNLLGYPQELLSKSRDLIYRYTVYTPQEQMKQIILEDKDIRLDTLRKVFNIDKYKRIKENSQIYIRELKERRKRYEGQIEDLEEKRQLKKEREDETASINEKLNELLPKIESIKKEAKEKKEQIEKKEREINEFNRLKKELELEELRLRTAVERRNSNKEDIEKLAKDIDSIKKELEAAEIKNIEEFLQSIKDKETQVISLRKAIIDISRKLSEFETIKKHSNEIKERVARMEKCPVCLQDVKDEHKSSINQREAKKIEELEEHIKRHKEEEQQNRNITETLEKELRELRKKETEIKAMIVKRQSLKEKESRKSMLEKEQDRIRGEIGKINTKKMDLSKKIEELKGIEEEYKRIKQELEPILRKEKELEINKRGLEVKIEEIGRTIKALEGEINKKLMIKENLNRISQYQNWLEEYFTNLMETIERHVMLQVYREFNELFQQWFNILIEDETLNVRLDDEFTPVIEQNGYESSIENLSGGERTAVALAYRLALNKVINDIIGEIKTKDILMLDEPTEGFSSEQLDKVRAVLDQLSIKQIIIVSHESKIESFVDNVIRINKNEHISQVA